MRKTYHTLDDGEEADLAAQQRVGSLWFGCHSGHETGIRRLLSSLFGVRDRNLLRGLRLHNREGAISINDDSFIILILRSFLFILVILILIAFTIFHVVAIAIVLVGLGDFINGPVLEIANLFFEVLFVDGGIGAVVWVVVAVVAVQKEEYFREIPENKRRRIGVFANYIISRSKSIMVAVVVVVDAQVWQSW